MSVLINLHTVCLPLEATLLSRRAVFLLIFAICFLSVTTWGTTYFVDNSNPLSSDNPSYGSEAKPLRTVSYGIALMNGGDILNVKSGIYREDGLYIPSNRSGTANIPTRIQACPGASVTICGDDINTGRVKITGCSFLIFDGFTVINLNQGIYVESSTNITVQNCVVRDVGQEGIHVNGNSTHVTIQNCVVHDTGKWIYNGEGIYIGTGSTGPVDNTAYITIRSNVVHHPGNTYGGEAIELKPGTHDCVVEHNTVHDVRSGSDVGAIEVNEALLGVQRWGSNPNHIVRNNVLYDMETAIRAGTGCLIYNNIIYNITNGCFGIYIDNHADDIYTRRIYHNTIDLPETNTVREVAGTADIRNNIGPSSSNNVAVKTTYFVGASRGDYHLLGGSAPVDAGVDLLSVVPIDFEGRPRTNGLSSDMGAYELSSH